MNKKSEEQNGLVNTMESGTWKRDWANNSQGQGGLRDEGRDWTKILHLWMKTVAGVRAWDGVGNQVQGSSGGGERNTCNNLNNKD